MDVTMTFTHPFQVEIQKKVAAVVRFGNTKYLPRRFVDFRADP